MFLVGVVFGVCITIVVTLGVLKYVLTTEIATPVAEARRAAVVAASGWSPEGAVRALASTTSAESGVFTHEGHVGVVGLGDPRPSGPLPYGVLHNNMLVLFASKEKEAHLGVVRLDGARAFLLPLDAGTVTKQLSPKYPLRLMGQEGCALYGSLDEVDLYFASAMEKDRWVFALDRAVRLDDDEYMGVDRMYRAKRDGHFGRLAQRVDTAEGAVPADWFNALVGRMFWTAHHNAKMVGFFRGLIQKKLDNVKLPKMVDSIGIKHFYIGPDVPLVQWVKLLDVSPDGQTTLEGEFSYSGGAQIIIEPFISVFSLEIPVCISIRLKRFDGHVQVHFDAPPSQRLWIGFYDKPHIELEVDTVLGTTYNINIPDITDIIVDRIKAELVNFICLPEMDCIPLPGGYDEPNQPNNVKKNAVGLSDDIGVPRAVLDLIAQSSGSSAPPQTAPSSSVLNEPAPTLHDTEVEGLEAVGFDPAASSASTTRSGSTTAIDAVDGMAADNTAADTTAVDSTAVDTTAADTDSDSFVIISSGDDEPAAAATTAAATAATVGAVAAVGAGVAIGAAVASQSTNNAVAPTANSDSDSDSDEFVIGTEDKSDDHIATSSATTTTTPTTTSSSSTATSAPAPTPVPAPTPTPVPAPAPAPAPENPFDFSSIQAAMSAASPPPPSSTPAPDVKATAKPATYAKPPSPAPKSSPPPATKAKQLGSLFAKKAASSASSIFSRAKSAASAAAANRKKQQQQQSKPE